MNIIDDQRYEFLYYTLDKIVYYFIFHIETDLIAKSILDVYLKDFKDFRWWDCIYV